jgi:hypothetical protein
MTIKMTLKFAKKFNNIPHPKYHWEKLDVSEKADTVYTVP